MISRRRTLQRESAFQQVRGELPKLCHSLMTIPPHRFWIHESVVCEILALRRGSIHGVSDVLHVVLQALKNTYYGNKKKGTRVNTGIDAVDLFFERNPSRVRAQAYGRQERFQGGNSLNESLIERKPNWFLFGTYDERGADLVIQDQQAALLELTGEARYLLPEVRARRRQLWSAFAKGHECGPFLAHDVPVIALRFVHTLWPNIKAPVVPSGGKIIRRMFDPVDLSRIEGDMRFLLCASNVCGKVNVVAGKLTVITSSKSRTRYVAAVTTPSPPRRPSIPVSSSPEGAAERRSSSTQTAKRSVARDGDPMPDCLRLASLRCVQNGLIDVKKVTRLAIFELIFRLKHNDGLVVDAIVPILKTKKVPPLDDFRITDLKTISGKTSTAAVRFISQARNELVNALHGFFFVPDDEANESLWEWLQQAKNFSSGRRVEAVNHEIHKDNGSLALTLEATYILRHIMFSFSLHIEQVVALWSCYYSLIMHRPIPEKYFTSESSLWANIMRICPIDERAQSKEFEALIVKRTPLGFKRYFYSSSDDSEHYKKCRHVLIVTNVGSDGYATFRHIASSVAFSKGSAGNSKKNFEDMLLLLGNVILCHYGGGCNDNASDALLEIHKTFDLVQASLCDSGLENEVMINGVRRRPIIFGDPFHVCNLVVNHFSKAAMGDPESGDHEQTHWRQLLMSMHSLHSRDTALSQKVLNDVMRHSITTDDSPRFADSDLENELAGEDPMAGADNQLTMKTAADRDQRWLVNQRNARWVVENLRHETPDGTPALVAWAIEMSNILTSPWQKRVGREIAVWLSTPSVVFSLYAEAEVGEYYEETMAWHNRPGPIQRRSGFRIMEIHSLYFRFELPYWNAMCNDLETRLPKTMAYINANFEGDEKQMRITQLRRGAIAGRKELVKMTTKNLLSCPLILLLLCDRMEGPFFLRAVLFVLYEAKAPSDVILIHDVNSPNWGTFRYGKNNLLMPSKERRYYDILCREADDVVHWWLQLCLNWPVLTLDLQNLSRIYVVDEKECAKQSGLILFRQDYPNLWECLDAVFGLFPSNSRLCEQIHGMMRKKLRIGTGQEESNKHRAYSTRTDYEMKQERRAMVPNPKKVAKKAKRDRATKSQVSYESWQVLSRMRKFCAVARPMIDDKQVDTVRKVQRAGRRVRDKLLVGQQMAALKEKQRRSRKERLSLNDVLREAETTRPSNDLILQSSDETLFFRKRLKEMVVQKFWDQMRDTCAFKTMFGIALRCFRIPRDNDSDLGVSLLEYFAIEHGLTKTKKDGAVVKKVKDMPKGLREKILQLPTEEPARKAEMDKLMSRFELVNLVRSKTAAMKVIGRCLNFLTKTFVLELDEFLHGVKGKDGEKPKRERAIDRMDIMGLILRPRDEAFSEDEVNPNTLLLVDEFNTIDPHYTYTKKELVTGDEVSFQGDDENGVELIEEQYNAGVESGRIVGPD